MDVRVSNCSEKTTELEGSQVLCIFLHDNHTPYCVGSNLCFNSFQIFEVKFMF